MLKYSFSLLILYDYYYSIRTTTSYYFEEGNNSFNKSGLRVRLPVACLVAIQSCPFFPEPVKCPLLDITRMTFLISSKLVSTVR
jgi:hypothetical protein